MTLAIVLAAAASRRADRPASARRPVDRPARRAGAAGPRRRRPRAGRAGRGGHRPVVVSGADLVAHTAVLRHLATSPVGPTGALVLTDPPAPARPGSGRTGARWWARARGASPARPPGSSAARSGRRGRPAAAARRAPRRPAPRRRAALAGPVGRDQPGTPPALAARVPGPRSSPSGYGCSWRTGSTTGRAGRRRGRGGGRRRGPGRAAAVGQGRDDFFTTYFVSTWSP